jgi:hypothetical protein
MRRLSCVCILPLLAVSAWGQAAPQRKPSAPPDLPDAMVASLYKEVVARHPLSTPDRKVFGPYVSKKLLHLFDADDDCFREWLRQNPDPNLKPSVGLIEEGLFSGSSEKSEPQTFHIEKTESRKDGSYRVRVKLTWEDASNKLAWHVVAVVVRENGRTVVDDVLYLKDNDRDIEYRLSAIGVTDARLQWVPLGWRPQPVPMRLAGGLSRVTGIGVGAILRPKRTIGRRDHSDKRL